MAEITAYLINGQSNTSVSPYDRGLNYGDGIFRTLVWANGRLEAWHHHFAQFKHDCKAIGIICTEESIWLADIAQLVSADEKSVIKLVITRGESLRGYASPLAPFVTRIVIKSAFPAYPQVNVEEGIQLHLCHLRLGYQPLLAGIKHLNRLENVLARSEWNNPDLAEGLLLDQSGYVVEGTMSNVWIREGQHLITPDLSDCGVAGVTRSRIIELAKSIGLSTSVTKFGLDRLLAADEVLVCNSLFGAWQVIKIQDKTWPKQLLAEKIRTLLALDNEHNA